MRKEMESVLCCYHQTPSGVTIPKASQLAFPTTNYVTEYEAFIAGQQAALQLDARQGDSKLVRERWMEDEKEKIETISGVGTRLGEAVKRDILHSSFQGTQQACRFSGYTRFSSSNATTQKHGVICSGEVGNPGDRHNLARKQKPRGGSPSTLDIPLKSSKASIHNLLIEE